MGTIDLEASTRLGADLVNIVVMLAIFLILAIAYLIRVQIKGRARFERVDRQGGTAILRKELMEMVYWGLQPIARLLVGIGVSPNTLTFVSLLFGLLSGVCLAVGHFGFGAVFGTVAALMDALDGLVARLSGNMKKSGVVFDSSADRYVEFFFLAGLIIYYRDSWVLVLLTSLALFGSFMVSYSTAKAEAVHVVPPRGNMRRSERATFLLIGAALCPIIIPLVEEPSYYVSPIGYPMVIAIGLVAVLSNVSAVERILAIARAVDEREAMRVRASISSELVDAEENRSVPQEL